MSGFNAKTNLRITKKKVLYTGVAKKCNMNSDNMGKAWQMCEFRAGQLT
jgi:hypothetical protein